MLDSDFEVRVYPHSVVRVHGGEAALGLGPTGKRLLVSQGLPGFRGEPRGERLLCPLSWDNAKALGALLPEFWPQRLPEGPSFGCGDRLGLATPGHIRSLEGAKVFPILAQQSVRENARTGRTFAEVLADAVFGAFQENYHRGFGADADHLKNEEQAVEAAQLGYMFFTCDPSDHLTDVHALCTSELQAQKRAIPWDELKARFLRKTFTVSGLGRIRFSQSELETLALRYWRALEFTTELYCALARELPSGFDFEVSLDEIDHALSPKEHLFWALELRERGIRLTSFAPRFPGALEKALDYRGDLEEFRRALQGHVAIARAYGPYKISLHSGSDKFSLYPILAEEAKDLWHVKTAGTSYLVALEIIAQLCPELFQEILGIARVRFEHDRVSYHTSADVQKLPHPWEGRDPELTKLIQDSNVRQILHITYGSVLHELGEDIKNVLLVNEEAYAQAIYAHFTKHLAALGVIDDE